MLGGTKEELNGVRAPQIFMKETSRRRLEAKGED
jgi:hypothetical protein